MEVRQQVAGVLADDQLDDESSELAKAEAIEVLIDRYGWDSVREGLLDVLRDDRQALHWRIAADVFWGAVLDRRELPVDELIALLYHRFDPEGLAEDNLVWSIASKLKGVGYLSEYHPLCDPEVIKHLQTIRARA